MKHFNNANIFLTWPVSIRGIFDPHTLFEGHLSKYDDIVHIDIS